MTYRGVACLASEPQPDTRRKLTRDQSVQWLASEQRSFGRLRWQIR
jgi:hypothetical protein